MKYLSTFSQLLLVGLIAGSFACSNAKKIEPILPSEEGETFNLVNPEASEDPNTADPNAWHEAIIKEVLASNRYSYLEVEENGTRIWLATSKGEFSPEQRLRYRGGLLKTNFKSEEHDRVFEKLYLVSQIQLEGASATPSTIGTPSPGPAKKVDPSTVKGAVTIKEIIQNPGKYKDKTVKILGTVSKVNPNIMGKNWIHVQDGSADQYDFVLTSASNIPAGHQVVFEGVIRLDVDFGAGYSYDIIMEDAKFSLQ